MSVQHPIIALTGSSGAGLADARRAFLEIFHEENAQLSLVDGNGFHRYTRAEMREAVQRAWAGEGKRISHFGPEGNLFEQLENLFRQYAHTGGGVSRRYLHTFDEAQEYGQEPGTFTPWAQLPAGSDALLYEGLHGGLMTKEVNVRQWVDLLVGVVPIINLEWIQKIRRDCADRGYSQEAVVDAILRRMPDYLNYIVPQFAQTDINFQRVPLTDTSDPFAVKTAPSEDESMIVVRFNKHRDQLYPYLLTMLPESFMSRPNNWVIPGGKLTLAMKLIFSPIVREILKKRRAAPT